MHEGEAVFRSSQRVESCDKNAAYPVAMNKLKADETIAEETELRQIKYLNNIIEQDYRNIKRIVKPMMGFQSFNSTRRTLSGIEVMNYDQERTGERNQERGQGCIPLLQ